MNRRARRHVVSNNIEATPPEFGVRGQIERVVFESGIPDQYAQSDWAQRAIDFKFVETVNVTSPTDLGGGRMNLSCERISELQVNTNVGMDEITALAS